MGRGARGLEKNKGDSADVVASRGAALRFGTAESQDASPCGAIHKQRPYRVGSGVARSYLGVRLAGGGEFAEESAEEAL
jgi:hypothetical protein